MIEQELFGHTHDGREVLRYTMTNSSGMSVSVLDRGCCIQQILVPDKTGTLRDVVLGYPDLAGYEATTAYVGALVGRNANRLGGAYLEIDGKRFELTANEGKNQLHGGLCGFDQKLFSCVADDEENRLRFSLISLDGEEGFPGNLQLNVTYTLTEENALVLEYTAFADQDTVINLTNHSYFNLNGHGSVLNHKLRLLASQYTEQGEQMLATGKILPVAGSPLDFTSEKALGEQIDTDCPQLVLAGGYDHNFILDKAPGTLAAVAMLTGDESGIRMVCATSCPCLQLYTANFLAGGPAGKAGIPYQDREAVCLETQQYPNAMNCPNFPKPIVQAGDCWQETTIYQFGV
ncbi:MAG: galactose mutarotase [Pygmaiobacter massiliensis]|nr:galactose mutarotase [Pygmaiobacter massiliensis]